PDGGCRGGVVGGAGVGAAGQPHPLAVSAHFLAPAEPGPAELETRWLRAGRSLSTARVTLVQEGAARVEALVTAGRLDPEVAPGWRRAAGPPELTPVEDCVPGQSRLPSGVPAKLLDHLDLRLPPGTAGWVVGPPGGGGGMRGWGRGVGGA